jgi:hypothetical protein
MLLVPSDSISPGGDIGPLEKALLLIEAHDAGPSRTRTFLRYGLIRGRADDASAPVSLVEVLRYNLGPAIRAQTMAAYGKENVASPEAFGVGPHVAWRFVFMPAMGNAAMLVDASRRVVPDEEAAGQDCLGRRCLDLEKSPDELQAWREQAGRTSQWRSAYTAMHDDVAVPARATAELADALGLLEVDGERRSWRGPEQVAAGAPGEPFLFVMIDRNLGQDIGIDAVLGQTRLNDDSIRELWWRRAEFPGQTFWFTSSVQR